jgi:uncharacterized iron-regulated membrane protein
LVLDTDRGIAASLLNHWGEKPKLFGDDGSIARDRALTVPAIEESKRQNPEGSQQDKFGIIRYGVRRLVLKIHLLLALVTGVFVAIFGITGSIMAFEPEIDHLLHASLVYVTPGPNLLSLAEIRAAVNRAFPQEPIGGFTLPASPGMSYQVSVPRGLVYVDPYTGNVLGVRALGGDFLAFIHQFHLRLALQRPGDPGKLVMSLAGLAILFSLLSGVYLWWPSKHISLKGVSGWRWWFELHNAVGILSFVFLFVLASTGVLIGLEPISVPLFYKVTQSSPSQQPKIPPAPSGVTPIGPDAAMDIARSALPGATPFAINIPGPKAAYVVRSRYPEDLTPGGRSRVIVDQYTGAVLFVEGSRTAPAGTRMVTANRAIHTGDIFGIPSKALASLFSLTLVLQLISGIVIWWKRP